MGKKDENLNYYAERIFIVFLSLFVVVFKIINRSTLQFYLM